MRTSIALPCLLATILVSSLHAQVLEDRLFSGSPASQLTFGAAVAIDDSVAVVGDPDENTSRGAIYVFHRNPNTTWTQTARFTAIGGSPGDRYGVALAIAGGRYVLIGVPNDDTTAPDAGAAYFLDLQTGTQTKLPSPGLSGDHFGTSVALQFGAANQLFAAICAPENDHSALQNPGAVYIHVISTTNPTWQLEATLTSLIPQREARFGSDVALELYPGNILQAVIGARFEEAPLQDEGTAYLFNRQPAGQSGIWTQVRLWRSGRISAEFGGAVALDGNFAVVGGLGAGVQAPDSGIALAFERDLVTGSWSVGPVAELVGGGGQGDLYGTDVSVLATSTATAVAVVGAPWDDPRGLESGAVFIHSRLASGAWATTGEELFAVYGLVNQTFGRSVTLDAQGRCIIGMSTLSGGAGQAQVFDLGRTGTGFLGRVSVEPAAANALNTLSTYSVASSHQITFLWDLQLGAGIFQTCPTGLRVPKLIGMAPENGFGEAVLPVFVPAAAAGRTILVQALDQNGCIASSPVAVPF